MAEDSSDDSIYLHGDLDLKIVQARCLPNMDMVSERLRRCIAALDLCRKPFTSSKTRHIKGEGKKRNRHVITSDPYVTVCLSGATVARTRVISNSQDPVWNEHLVVPLAHPATEVEFHVKDDDTFGADLIGVATVPAQLVNSGQLISDWFPLTGPYSKPPKQNAAVFLEMKFTKCDENPIYRSGPDRFDVERSYFPVRCGGGVTLYQDAHVPENALPEIKLDKGVMYRQGQCWEDICHAILEAHHLVYIVGWSIFHKVKLVREPTKGLASGGDLALGDLLKYKSEEGVRVLLLVWDDKTSHSKFGINTLGTYKPPLRVMGHRFVHWKQPLWKQGQVVYIRPFETPQCRKLYALGCPYILAGVMQTHDEETRKFFKHSSVHCVLSPRYASSKLSIFKQQVVGTLYTHHQKCVIVDTQGNGNNRKITAFIGGLDLCDGRYDTPEHRLFRDLDTVYKDDFHNPTFPAGSKAPREPWHDMHCKIEGPAAYDVLKNFEQRWKKATKWSELGRRFKRISHWHDDALIKIERISWILSPSPSVANDDPELWVSKENDPQNWHVQIFRSIDSGSIKGFPKDVQLAEAENLVCAKNLIVDKSIQTAYIQAIRSAQHFIYIENQYFLGSSYAWPSYKAAGADNLIPMELALKIVSKIRAKDRFAVYVVIPMWPEGVPTSNSVQEILYWQGQTMQMMYEIIAKELQAMHIEDAHPTDYLNFYCLGNREKGPEEDSSSHSQTPSNSDTVSASYKFGRFMIYVHAKGMIVDDEYVILGSANINQRSMAGSRDTEIAMGAYQPHQTWSKKKKHPRGQVYGYRMSLWVEHLGKVDENFKKPETLKCVAKVNKIAEDNWTKFTTDEFTPLQGHLLKYPVKIDENGKVSSLHGQENFPDVGGKITGCPTSLPDALTT